MWPRGGPPRPSPLASRRANAEASPALAAPQELQIRGVATKPELNGLVCVLEDLRAHPMQRPILPGRVLVRIVDEGEHGCAHLRPPPPPRPPARGKRQ